MFVRKLFLSVFLLVSGRFACAQFTTVSGTVTDPNGLPYAYGTLTPTLIVPSGAGSPKLPNGSFYFPPSAATGLDVNGHFIVTLGDNSLLTPASTKWNFQVCSAIGTVPPAFGKGNVCFSLAAPITISGSSQNISTNLNAAALALTFNFGGGTPASPVGSVQYNNAGAFGAISSVAPGSAYVSNGTLVPPITQTKPQIDVRDGFGGSGGVDCTGTADSTTALQGMINNAPDYSSFIVPAECVIKVSGTPGITIDSRFGLQFVFEGRNGNNCVNSSTPAQILYNQTYAAGNVVLYINRSQALEFINLMINVNNKADIGIDIDQVGATPPITTRNDFYSPCIANNFNRNSSFKGIRVSNTSISNVENQHFYHPDVICSSLTPTSISSNGFAIWFSASANQKNEIVEDLRTTNCSVDLNNGNGSDNSAEFGAASSTFANFQMEGANDEVFGFRTENANIPIQITNAIGPHYIVHNDFAAVAGTNNIDCPSGCGATTLIGNEADTNSLPWFNVHANPGAGTLFATQNRNSNLNPLDWLYSWDFEPGGWISSTFSITPGGGVGLGVVNLPSPPLQFQTVSGNAHNYDNFVVEAFAEGPLANTPTSQNWELFYTGTNTNYITLGSPLIDFKVGPNATSAGSVAAVSTRGAAGATTWCYAVVANTLNGHSAVSSNLCTNTGNATLTSSNFNFIQLNWYSGAISYSIYRTTSGGTPSTTGKIATVSPQFVYVAGVGLALSDTGLAGDSTTAPATNTTGAAIFNGPTTVNAAFTATTIATSTNCAASGTAANPSVVSCSSAASGAVACSVSASAGTCQVNTTAVGANSRIFVQETSAENTSLGVTCNTSPTVLPAIAVASKSAGASFTMNMPTFTTNPACFDYWIVDQ